MDRGYHAREDDYETYIQTYDEGKPTRWKRYNSINYMSEFRPAKPDPIRVYLHIALLDDRDDPSAVLGSRSDDVVIRLDREGGPAMTTFAARVRENLIDLFDGL